MTTGEWQKMVDQVTKGASADAGSLEALRSEIGRQLERLTAPSVPQAATQGATSSGGSRQLLGWSPSTPLAGPAVAQGALPSLVSSVLPSASNSGKGVGGTLLSVFTSGLGLSPLISGLLSLFGGGKKEQLPPLVKFALPAAVSLQAGITSTGATGDISYGQNGLPRMIPNGAQRNQAITVQVQTIDAKSFMDHSEEIARAVRDAMLYSHSLNDVVTDL